VAPLSFAGFTRIRDDRGRRPLQSAQAQSGWLRANTRRYIDDLLPDLEELDRLIESPQAVSGALSTDDIRVLPLLRSAATVKGLQFPRRVLDYFETMMQRIEYRPLPVV
jgi:glutaredoxin 2